MAKNKENQDDLFSVLAIRNVLRAANPWWEDRSFSLDIPTFKRDSFDLALEHMTATHRLALLINGPRRVGKTTLIYQLIQELIRREIDPRRIMFFSLDDPLIQQLPPNEQGAFFDQILKEWATVAGTPLRSAPQPLYCFLDEVQRLPRWELYLKRYIDLRYPIRFVISGSASHTIFRRSLESLIGRLADLSLPPFTFREFVRYHHDGLSHPLLARAREPFDIGSKASVAALYESLSRDPAFADVPLWNRYADEYALAGGFPQLWAMPGGLADKASFIDEQFVRLVTLEDLRLVREIRKPEVFHRFLRYAFARTSEEYNLEELHKRLKASRTTLADALPLLLQTELLRKVERYTGKPTRLRSTHAKLYAADPMLTQAITRRSTSLEGEDRGRIAETLVHNTIALYKGISDITYYRGKGGASEVDFIVHAGTSTVPIEVCYRNTVDAGHQKTVAAFVAEHGKRDAFGVLVTKEAAGLKDGVYQIPLPFFLLTA